MTEEEFKTYRFSVRTQVKYRGEWDNITEVDFGDKCITTKKTGNYLKLSEIEEIRY